MDLEVRPLGEEVVIVAGDGRSHRVVASEWRKAVCGFADAVHAFYIASSPKRPSDTDEKGYKKFMSEWSRRRSLADSHDC
jgi:hypothetical protein